MYAVSVRCIYVIMLRNCSQNAWIHHVNYSVYLLFYTIFACKHIVKPLGFESRTFLLSSWCSLVHFVKLCGKVIIVWACFVINSM